MKRFLNQTVLKYVLVSIVVLLIGLFAWSRNSQLAVPAIMLSIGALLIVLQAWAVDLKKTLSRIEWKLRQQTVDSELSRKQNAVGTESSNRIVVKNTPDPQLSRANSESKANKGFLSALQAINSMDDLEIPRRRRASLDLNVMVIADEFTAAAFKKEWNQIEPTPENFTKQLEENLIDLLFVESAWAGNGGTWKCQLVGQTAPRIEIKELVAECRKRGIPTAFWNKEDPPHFEDFLATARLFDFVFTTEEAKVEEYRKLLGHDRVAVLPFAAQPCYHNPARTKGIRREGNAVFGGMYFREKYPERRAQMDYLLPAAQEFGLDIFSRNAVEEKYRFPDSLAPLVRGSLPYPQMVGAYHAYKVVLNVNSVPESESMCARRIFEASACGAAVVSPSSNAIRNFFPNGEIGLADDRDHARNLVRALVRSDLMRKRQVHLAQRTIWENHTYSNRVETVLDFIGLEHRRKEKETSISIIIPTNRPDSLPIMVENLRRQAGVEFEVAIVTHGFEMPLHVAEAIRGIPHITRLVVEPAAREKKLGSNLNRLVTLSKGDFIVRMDDDDWYGPNYVRDMYNAAMFSGADLVGKAATYVYFEALDSTIITNEQNEHAYVDFVRGPTFAGPRETFERFPFPEIGKSEDTTVLRNIKEAGGLIYSSDPYNFVVNRYADEGRHTWKPNDLAFFATGRMVYRGNAQDQVSI